MMQIRLNGPKSSQFFALVDDIDFEFLSQWRWCVTGKGHVGRCERYRIDGEKYSQKRNIWMHRVIAERAGMMITGMQLDHENLDKKDNRRANLRLATNQQNQANRPPGKNNTSGIKGVHWHKMAKGWAARIGVNGRRFHLGTFGTAEDARLAYQEAAIKFFGEFARS